MSETYIDNEYQHLKNEKEASAAIITQTQQSFAKTLKDGGLGEKIKENIKQQPTEMVQKKESTIKRFFNRLINTLA